MRKHHTLMIKRGPDGEIVEGIEVSNAEWPQYRRQGYEFSTPAEREQYEAHLAASLREKNQRRDAQDHPEKTDDLGSDDAATGGSIEGPAPGGWYTVTFGDRVEKVQGERNAKEKLEELQAEAEAS